MKIWENTYSGRTTFYDLKGNRVAEIYYACGGYRYAIYDEYGYRSASKWSETESQARDKLLAITGHSVISQEKAALLQGKKVAK